MGNKRSNHTFATGVPKPLVTLVRRINRFISVNENITYGANLRVGRGSVISSPHGLRFGNNVSVGPRSIIQVDGEIDDFALIGMGVQIVGRKDHATDQVGVPITFATRAAERVAAPHDAVHIGKDVWVGAASVILSGVSIGFGSVVAAGSVVTKDVAEFTIVGGNPAAVIGRRFADDQERALHRQRLEGL